MENTKYVVKVINIFSNLIQVEAENEEAAKVKAKEFLTNKKGEEDFPLYYDSTLPEEFWQVITEDKLEELKKEVQAASETNDSKI